LFHHLFNLITQTPVYFEHKSWSQGSSVLTGFTVYGKKYWREKKILIYSSETADPFIMKFAQAR
jgi:hypothetical protein